MHTGQLVALVFLTSILPSLQEDPYCSLDYGVPTFSDCLDLTNALYSGWPSTTGDGRIHVFSLRHEPIPEGLPPAVKNGRTWLPKFA